MTGYWQNYSNGDYIGSNNRGRARGRGNNRDDVYDNRNRTDSIWYGTRTRAFCTGAAMSTASSRSAFRTAESPTAT